ncbi:uncharacterized protein LOC105196188 isoform X1 [Solenopsis invicta]|uniref:uncharacterized protein LOC105196188 isoform X1 n=1 Tax=Solenopsis invicta TaxID=13686 RepID=UPI00193DC24E|nr:uncharacterized protein LOC105196188 isoform X1 [Solenopsis invicta]
MDEFMVTGNYNVTCKKRKMELRNNSESKTFHSKIHPDKCNSTDKSVRRRSKIWDKYYVTGNYAICKECTRQINISDTKHQTHYLWNHLKIYHPNKFNISDLKNKHLIMWDKCIIDGNLIICKRCNKTFKHRGGYIKRISQHLKRKQCQSVRRLPNTWDKYYVKGNYAIGKECKRQVNIPNTNATEYLWNRSKIDHLNKFNVNNMKNEHLIVCNKYIITSNLITCKRCNKTFNHKRGDIKRLNQHLKSKRCQSLRRLSNIWDKYYVTGNYAVCKECEREVNIPDTNRTKYLWNHLKIDHPNKFNISDMNNKHLILWDKYIITGNLITCKRCKKKFKHRRGYVKRLSQHLKSKRCQTAESTSIEGKEFDDTLQPQSKTQIIDQIKPFKQEIKTTDYNFREASRMSSSIEGNDFHGTTEHQSEKQIFKETNPLKQETEITYFNLWKVSSKSSSIEGNDFHSTIKPQSERQAFEDIKPLNQEIEITDYYFGEASSMSSSVGNNDFHGTIESQGVRKKRKYSIQIFKETSL